MRGGLPHGRLRGVPEVHLGGLDDLEALAPGPSTQNGPPPGSPSLRTTPQTRIGRSRRLARSSVTRSPARSRFQRSVGPRRASGTTLSMFFTRTTSAPAAREIAEVREERPVPPGPEEERALPTSGTGLPSGSPAIVSVAGACSENVT